MALESKTAVLKWVQPASFSGMLTFGFMLVSASLAYAQVSGEALWRADNDLPAAPAPLYEGQKSPFPQEAAPVVIREEPSVQVPIITPQQAESQRQAREAASRMSRIRELLKNEEAFIPDTSNIVVSAIAKGPTGSMALIKGQWMFEGDTVEAPVKTATQLMDLMQSLERADPNLAGIVSKEVEKRLASVGPRKMMIKKIKPDGIVLRRPDGKTTVISFVSQGW